MNGVPKGYQPLPTWIAAEVRRRLADPQRAQQVPGNVMEQAIHDLTRDSVDLNAILTNEPSPEPTQAQQLAARMAKDAFAGVLQELQIALGRPEADGQKLALCIAGHVGGVEIPSRLWHSELISHLVSGGRIRFVHELLGEISGPIVVKSTVNLQTQSPEVAPPKKLGRTPKWDWEKGINCVWAHVYEKGDSTIRSQADVMRLLIDKMTTSSGESPSETEAKRRARMIFDAMQRDS